MADNIREWLEGLGLSQYADIFAENGIDVDILADLEKDDFAQLGVSLGDRVRLQKALAQGKETPTGSENPNNNQQIPSETHSSGRAERRQLTVLFCDLVGSTTLSQELDPEDLRDVMRRYQDAVAGAVTRFGGFVAKYLGDGVLAYFGWPQAYEDQAERSVRAGLEAIKAVADLAIDEHSFLSARVGIATGQVVVGDLIGESGRDAEAVTGETPNLAARLQGLAAEGQVVIGQATYQLVSHAFRLEDTGMHPLKGFEHPLQVWAVTGETALESRFDAVHAGRLNKIVGRDSELRLLLDRWRQARAGEGQTVLISGEAGIGKSRLIQGLQDEAEGNELVRLRYQCSPYHTNSALYPIIQNLQRSANFAPEDSTETKVEKLQALLGQTKNQSEEILGLFANLLSLKTGGLLAPPTRTPEQMKEDLLATLVQRLLDLSHQKPVLFLFEDAHWIDPTSLELLERTIVQLQSARLLMVITHRPEWQSSLADNNSVTSLKLNRLGREQGARIVETIAGQTVPQETIDRIVARTDGVPLFIEELTKAMAETGFDMAEEDVPLTLQASLLARLDRLNEAKEIAQIASVIGREFDRDLLSRLLSTSDVNLTDALDKLLQSQLIYPSSVDRREIYTFKHALIQDIAYDSLLRRRRQELHLAIASLLADTETPNFAPEVLARHFELGGDLKNALRWLETASATAAQGSAQYETIEHCMSAIRILDELEDWPEGRDAELLIQLRLGQAQFGVFGAGSDQVAKTFKRASLLSEQTEDRTVQVIAQYGLYVHFMLRADLENSVRIGKQVRAIGQNAGVSWIDIVGIRLTGGALALMGEIEEGHNLMKAFIVDAPQYMGDVPSGFAHNPIATAPSLLSHLEWASGDPEAALERSWQSVEQARQLGGDGNTLPYALTWDILLGTFERNTKRVANSATALLEYTETTGGAFWMQFARWGQGTAHVFQGDVSSGMPLIISGLNGTKATGAVQHIPHMLLSLAEAYYLNQDYPAAMKALTESQEIIEQTGQRFYEPEMHRWRGNVLLAMAQGEEAKAAYECAVSVAGRQKSLVWKKRAEESLKTQFA